MHAWRTNQFPAVAIQGQLHVTPEDKVYEYDAASQAWLAEPTYYIKETAAMFLQCVNMTTGLPAWHRNICPDLIIRWDDFYGKSLVEATLIGPEYPSGGPKFYQTDMRQTDLEAWLRTVIPHGTGNYETNCQLRVFEVFDPAIKCQQAIGINLLYSQCRGGMAYGHRLLGRRKRGLPNWHQSAPRFDGAWFDDTLKPFGRACLEQFEGITPATDNNGIIWFPNASRNLYGQINPNARIMSSDRPMYNVVTGLYGTPGGECTTGTPQLLVLRNYPADRTRTWENMQILRGSSWLGYKASMMVVYPVIQDDWRAYFVKPYGLDYVNLRISPANEGMTLTARNVRQRGWTGPYRQITDVEYSNRLNLYRFKLIDAVRSFSPNRGVDDDWTPTSVRFHLHNYNTGLRSEEFDTEIRFVRRRRNVSIAPVLYRAGFQQ